jgi:hypothetical protein
MDPFMTLWVFVIGAIVGLLIGVGLSYKTAVTPLQQKLHHSRGFQQNDLQGMLRYYPFHLDNFRFIGSPVDGIQFDDEVILFIHFQKDDLPRTKEQTHIKHLVENGKVKWLEFMKE